jgi:hypothetical protein
VFSPWPASLVGTFWAHPETRSSILLATSSRSSGNRCPYRHRFAIEMVGLSTPDPLAAQWLIRRFLALWYWPLKDADAEAEAQMARRFLGPPYAGRRDGSDVAPRSNRCEADQ